MTSSLKSLLSPAVWPGFFLAGMAASAFAFSSSHPLLVFVGFYLAGVLALGALEKLVPHQEDWLRSDGEAMNDIAHTLLTKGAVEALSAIATLTPLISASILQPILNFKPGLWPEHWPLFFQVVLALIIAEFGLYWAHRIAHERLFFWRFHALHHSVEKLWVVNTGRFHVMDSLFKVCLSQVPLYLMGAPLSVFLWVGAVTAYIGLLTHCNIRVKTGPLDYVFSTPNLHRWHHSREIWESNTNYGENLVLFDLIFSTYYNPAKAPPKDIGISGRVAKGFVGQILQPFSQRGVAEILGKQPIESNLPHEAISEQKTA
ncbi:sterol desaturase family protein [Allorhizobium sp. BGMRC 0089]|uniref:sterol desaturase family protein n=1 Tax=Allorhizobium sonneratiae TaxID=2934936 RepID=UPI0020332A12|nr:sterol desaturase family protein [Allorhizobium sonneratiae]MCM2290935.1 sterol desaturase family protein [Allorhizobium sonneratiae]